MNNTVIGISRGIYESTNFNEPQKVHRNFVSNINNPNNALVATGIQRRIFERIESYETTKSGILIPNMKEHSFITIPKAEILRPELSSGLVLA